MKHLLLSLVLLSSMPLFPKNAAANPTATVGNSASAAAAPESEVKRKGAEADVKSDNSHFSLDQIHSSVIPALRDYLPEQLSYLVAGAVVAERDLRILTHRQLKLVEKWLIGRMIDAAKPNPSWELIKDFLQKGFVQHGVGFLPDLTNIVVDYAQGDLEPIQAIFKKIMNDASFVIEYGSHVSLTFDARQPSDEALIALRQAQGTVFVHDKEILDKWKRAGFEFQPQLNQDDLFLYDRMVCSACRNLHKSRGREAYRDPFGRVGRLFGDVTGTSLFWRNPFAYHRKGCKAAANIKKSMSTAEIAQQNMIPILRTHPKEFAGYILLQLDLWARRCWRDHNDSTPRLYYNMLMGWFVLPVIWSLSEIPYHRTTHAFEQDPQAWVELQNKRAEELGSAVRYKLPEKPATK